LNEERKKTVKQQVMNVNKKMKNKFGFEENDKKEQLVNYEKERKLIEKNLKESHSLKDKMKMSSKLLAV
jgi:hypothetical protein